MKYLALIQARCDSTRLPNKVLKNICGKPSLQHMIERVQRSQLVDEVMVITSIEKANLPILKLCAEIGVRVGVGSEDDVLDRYYQTARLLKPEYVIRLTGDCPCADHKMIDDMLMKMDGEADYYSNTIVEDMADGLDTEIIRFSALERSWREARHSFEREHVTQYVKRHPEQFKCESYGSPIGYFGDHRWTVDEAEDFEVIRRIFEHFLLKEMKEDFDYRDILAYMNEHPEVKAINKMYQRNEGLQKSIAEDKILTLDNI